MAAVLSRWRVRLRSNRLVVVWLVSAIVIGAVLGWSLQFASGIPVVVAALAVIAIIMMTIALTMILMLMHGRRIRQLSETMFRQSPVATMRVRRESDGRLVIVAANRALGIVLGCPANDLAGQRLIPHFASQHATEVDALFRDATSPAGARWNPQREVEVVRSDESPRIGVMTVAPLPSEFVSKGSKEAVGEFIAHIEDVTARRAAEREVTQYAMYDRSTGLLNREAFFHRLDAALHRNRGEIGNLSVLILDVDDIKNVNESLGFAAGDRLLVAVALRLAAHCGDESALSRIGGDEYALIVSADVSRDKTAVLAGQLVAAVGQELDLGQPVRPRVSVGIATSPDPSVTSEELMRRADLALYRAKRNRMEETGRDGRDRVNVEFYSESIGTNAEHALNIKRELGQAIANDSLAIALQPVVSMTDSSCLGFEALVRLRSGDRILAPGQFLDAARSMDLIPALDDSVLRKSLAAMAGDYLPVQGVGVSVNVEAEEIQETGFAMRVLELLSESTVPPERLTIEITESALLSLDDVVVENVRVLRDSGVKIAIDDFGTGYSSLSQLRHLTADILKIDRSFVTGMESDPEAAAIVKAVIQLAHDLGLVTIAEGVETREQAEILASQGCDRAQGYLFGKPEVLEPPVKPQPSIQLLDADYRYP